LSLAFKSSSEYLPFLGVKALYLVIISSALLLFALIIRYGYKTGGGCFSGKIVCSKCDSLYGSISKFGFSCFFYFNKEL